jgi:hypothetical protein
MKDEDIQNLLGGFATGTLSERERELLFTAALTNQELFNALADDQALREFLDDPASRRQLLNALQPRESGLLERLTSWMRRPASLAMAGGVMAALVVGVAIRQSRPPALQPAPLPAVEMAKRDAPAQVVPSPKAAEPVNAPEAFEARRERVKKRALRDEAPAEEKPTLPSKDRETGQANTVAPAAPAPPPPPMTYTAPPAPATAQPRAVPAPAPQTEMAASSGAKLKLAVLDFDSARLQKKEADSGGADVGKTASDLLGKRLDSSGYTVIDRKQVDKALQDQNLNRRQLDASTAASFGRSVGADAVIVGSVAPIQQAAQKSGAVGGIRAPSPVFRSKVAGQSEVQVTAQAINTQTAGNLGVAVSQGEQTPGGGLAGAVDRVASSLGQQIQLNTRPKIEGLVTDVNASILTLNAGIKAGVKVGDRLEVRRGGKPIGRVAISAVKDSFSVGSFEGSGPAKIGDTITNQ